MAISLVLDHFRTVAEWARRHNADAHLDLKTFCLTVRRNASAFRFYPLFPARAGDQFVHLTALSDQVVGFGGWLPYRPYQSRWSSDKLLFKEAAERRGLATPTVWSAGRQPDAPYILKRSQGSFGYDISGPFPAQHRIDQATPPNPTGRGDVFAEQFVEGEMAKIWFWGQHPFFVHLQSYPRIVGDGLRTARELAARKVAQDRAASGLSSQDSLVASLAFQGVAPGDVLEQGRSVWIDFRYGRTFETRKAQGEDNALPRIWQGCSDQLEAMGRFAAQLLVDTAPVALMCSVDAVLDVNGKLWWLEMNSNSILPHVGYETILPYLFDLQSSSPEQAQSAPAVQ